MRGNKALGRLETAIRSFREERSGNFALAFAAASSMVVLAAGYGVNTVQLFNVKAQISHALDGALTSTARDITTGKIAPADAEAMVEAFFRSNIRDGFVGAEDVVLNSLVVDPVEKTVSGTASVDVALAFPVFGADKTRMVSTESVAQYSDKKIEVAMMLDVTGSMGENGGRKMRDLKEAAALAVDTMLGGQDARNPRTRVSIVPYSEAVNVGALASNTVFRERVGGPDVLYADAPILASASGADTCATERKLPNGRPDYSDESPSARRPDDRGRATIARVNRDDRLGVCPSARLVPLTADADALKRQIRNFSPNGVTAGGIAAQWGHYMLSPKWRTPIRDAGLGDGPANHDARKVGKIAILMTDGLFNTAFAGTGRGRPQLDQALAASANAEAVCEAMKRDGIQVYTIGFDLDNVGTPRADRDRAKATLRACANEDTDKVTYFYQAANGEELTAAFLDIIRNMERLAIVR